MKLFLLSDDYDMEFIPDSMAVPKDCPLLVFNVQGDIEHAVDAISDTLRRYGVTIPVVICTPGMSVEAMDESTMNALGWYRRDNHGNNKENGKASTQCD